jgi:thymidylate synthase
MHPERQYLNLVKYIINHGSKTKSRNGTTLNTIGTMSKYRLIDNTIPLLTTKKVAWKTCLKELLWFIRGDTNNETLQLQNVHIWDGNSTREFLDSRDLHHYKENELGPIYGYQWRNWNAHYNGPYYDHRGDGIDQLSDIINKLKDPNEKYSRRLILSAWNVSQLDQMALPPCHVLSQFHVLNDNELYCTLYQRSGDVGLGVPFNIASYSFLTHMIANICNLKATELTHYIGNAHIYENHIEPLKQQIERDPYDFPKLHINDKSNIDSFRIEDFTLDNYKYYPSIKMEMVA